MPFSDTQASKFQRYRIALLSALGLVVALSVVFLGGPLPDKQSPQPVEEQRATFTKAIISGRNDNRLAIIQEADPAELMKAFENNSKNPVDLVRALECMTNAIYYEAGSESADGQRAVAQVILNRVRHPAFPDTVCGVVFQGSTRTTGCQFTFTCDGSLLRAPAPGKWSFAETIARSALEGTGYPAVGSATHYHANYVTPYWSSSLSKIGDIGLHVFYRWQGGAGETAAFSRNYRGNEPAISDPLPLGPADTPVPFGSTLAATGEEETVHPSGTKAFVPRPLEMAQASEITGKSCTDVRTGTCGSLTLDRKN